MHTRCDLRGRADPVDRQLGVIGKEFREAIEAYRMTTTDIRLDDQRFQVFRGVDLQSVEKGDDVAACHPGFFGRRTRVDGGNNRSGRRLDAEFDRFRKAGRYQMPSDIAGNPSHHRSTTPTVGNSGVPIGGVALGKP